MNKKNLKLLFILSLVLTTLVGCGTDEKQALLSNEIGAVEEVLTQKENNTEMEPDSEIVTEDIKSESTENEVFPEGTVIIEYTPTPEPESMESTEVVPTPTPTPEPIPTPEPTPTPTPEPEKEHNHNYVMSVQREGNACIQTRIEVYTCDCGDSHKEYIRGEHVSDGKRVYSLEPTCRNDGVECEHCIVCGGRLNSKQVPALGCEAEDFWTYNRTAGIRFKLCKRCGISVVTEPIPEGE